MAELCIALATVFGFLCVAGLVLFSAWQVGLTVLRGMQRLRFSLSALLTTVFTGGLCATLLTSHRESIAFFFGIVLTGVLVMLLLTHILGLGAFDDAEFEKYRERQRARGALF